MVTELEKLTTRLEEDGSSIRGITLGDKPNITSETIAKQINAALDAYERGEYDNVIVTIGQEDIKPKNIKR